MHDYSRLIAIATIEEAYPTIQTLSARALTDDVWKSDHGLIVITGIGVVTSAAAIAPWMYQCAELLNLGIVGSLRDTLMVGQVVEVTEVRRHLNLPANLDDHSRIRAPRRHPPIIKKEPGATCFTSDYAIHRKDERTLMGRQGDVVDMEGYGLAAVATACSKPWRMIKVVSDFAQEGGPQLIKATIKARAEQIAELAKDLVNVAPTPQSVLQGEFCASP